MKNKREIRKPAYEDWVILTEDQNVTLSCTLLNSSDSGAMFEVKGSLDIDERIIACPSPEDSLRATLSPYEIKSHPDKKMGRVVREDGLGKIAVEFMAQETNEVESIKKVISGTVFQFKVSHEPLFTKITATGKASMQEFADFCDHIKKETLQAESILIDLKHVESIDPMGKVFFKKTIEELRCGDCKVAVINMKTVGEVFSEQLNKKNNIRDVNTNIEAKEFLSES